MSSHVIASAVVWSLLSLEAFILCLTFVLAGNAVHQWVMRSDVVLHAPADGRSCHPRYAVGGSVQMAKAGFLSAVPRLTDRNGKTELSMRAAINSYSFSSQTSDPVDAALPTSHILCVCRLQRAVLCPALCGPNNGKVAYRTQELYGQILRPVSNERSKMAWLGDAPSRSW
jgi:hypothetical protein